MDEDAVRELAAMRFAAGMPIAQVAAELELDTEWIEEAIRLALLKYIPRRDGGLKLTRAEMRSANAEDAAAWRESQGTLNW